MIRSVLRSKVRKMLGEVTAVFWQDSELNQWADDGQLIVVQKAKLKRTRGTFTTVASTARYDLSTILPNFLRVVDGGVQIYDSTDSKWHKVTFKTKDYMDRTYGDWTNSDASRPIHYVEDYDEDVLELWPKPSSSVAGTNYCRVWYSSKPTAMLNDSSSPDIPEVLHDGLVEYVVAKGFESRGYGDLANDHLAKFYDHIKAYMIEKNNREDQTIVMRSYRSA